MMNLNELLGNEPLKERLSELFRQGKFSHCYLLSGPEGSGKHTLSLLLSAALQCTGSGPRPCRVCPQCRKVFSHGHPDVIDVDDASRKTLSVEQIRGVCADVFIRPNEGVRKIYRFPHAEKLTIAGQNTLLKVLEEPPAYAVFLLMAPSPGLLLPTIRSRCATLHLSPLPQETLLSALRTRAPGHTEEAYWEAAQGGYLGAALEELEQPRHGGDAFAAAFAKKDALSLLEVLTPMEKWKREQLLPVLQEWDALLTEALASRFGAPGTAEPIAKIRDGRTAREILRAAEAVRQAELRCGANVSPGAICGALAVQLSDTCPTGRELETLWTNY